MKIKRVLLIISLLSTLCLAQDNLGISVQGMKEPWRGVHMSIGSRRAVEQLTSVVPKLSRLGINVIVGEINYGYQYKSHPELARNNASDAKSIKNLPAPDLSRNRAKSMKHKTTVAAIL